MNTEHMKDRKHDPTIFIGIAMGICDAVPGVSGSTMALVCGIYHDLIKHIHEILAGIKRLPSFLKNDLVRMVIFFGPLAAGIGLGLVSALKLLVGDHADLLKEAARSDDRAQVREAIAEQNGWLMQAETAPIVFAVFFGLIIATLSVPWQQRNPQASTGRGLALAGFGTLCAVAASLLSVSLPMHPAIVFLGGLLAISAMLLPGISGSLILLLLGLYQPISVAARSLDFGVVLPFGMGMLLGVVIMVPLLNLLLKKANNDLMAFLTGLLFWIFGSGMALEGAFLGCFNSGLWSHVSASSHQRRLAQHCGCNAVRLGVVFFSRRMAKRLQKVDQSADASA